MWIFSIFLRFSIFFQYSEIWTKFYEFQLCFLMRFYITSKNFPKDRTNGFTVIALNFFRKIIKDVKKFILHNDNSEKLSTNR